MTMIPDPSAPIDARRELLLARFEAGLREVVTAVMTRDENLDRFLHGDLTVVFDHRGFTILRGPALLPDDPPPPEHPPTDDLHPGMYL